jgi:predicted DsbA family dithiol-disulfide isomerase
VRLRRVASEYRGQAVFSWHSYLLRPEPGRARDLEKFRAYTRSWLRPAEEPESGEFRVWSSDEGPPSHSVPPHRVAKAAARLGDDEFQQRHELLLRAYFAYNRYISRDSVLEELWQELGFPIEKLAVAQEPEILQEVLRQHHQARELGANGVPAVRLEGNDAVIVGAHATDLYRRWIDRTLARA